MGDLQGGPSKNRSLFPRNSPTAKCKKPPFYEFQKFSECGERAVIMAKLVFFSLVFDFEK